MEVRNRMMVAAAVVGLFVSSTAFAGGMDLMMRKMSTEVPANPSSSLSKAVENEAGKVLIPCFVRTLDPLSTIAAIEKAGGRAVTISTQDDSIAILSAKIPPCFASALAAREEVKVVEAAVPLSQKMDTARTYSNTVAVQDGSGLGVAYTGTNVVVGFVDDGLDYTHPDFINSDGKNRVQYVRQNEGSVVLECTHTSIQAGTCSIEDGGQGTTHGTHVTGIGASNNETYLGVAPTSDIMFVFNAATDATTSDSGETSLATAVIEGVSAIFGKADIIDKPCVVNLSLGTSIGAHDGTSLLEEGLTELTASGPGRIVVNAAGNEQVIPAAQPAERRDYVGGIHAQINAPAGQSVGYRIGVWSGITASSTFVGGTLADIWVDAGLANTCDVAAFAYTEGRDPLDFTFPGLATTDNATFATVDIPLSTDASLPNVAADALTSVSVDVDSSDVRNGKPHAMMVFAPVSSVLSSDLETRWFDVVIRSKGASACTGHIWLYYDYVSVHDFLKGVAGTGHDVGTGGTYAGYVLGDGDSLYTATIPSTAVGVISAGSWMPPKPVGSSASEWTGDNGVTYDQSDLSAPGGTGSVTGDLSSFSSLGPTADERIKPDIVAPGEPIISTLATGSYVSTSIKVGGDHYKSAGTSMASPHAAGIVALLLERNNTLTVDQVRTALQVGASTEGMTVKTPDPANSYGAGKVNAVRVLDSVVEDHSAYSGTGDLDGEGGGGCSISMGQEKAWGVGGVFLVLFGFVIAVVVARKKLLKIN